MAMMNKIKQEYIVELLRLTQEEIKRVVEQTGKGDLGLLTEIETYLIEIVEV